MKKNYTDLTQALNTVTRKSIRWCTPSIDPDMEKVKNIYESDMSVSYEGLGFLSEPSGVFLKAFQYAAKIYGSDKTIFSVNGSTGGNFIALRSLSKQIPHLRVLAQRNIHLSVLHACQDYGIDLCFLDSHIDSRLQIFLPNTITELISGIKRNKPHVILITNPTYEGFTLDLNSLVKEIRKLDSKLIIYIEEAWGSHLKFSDKLPVSAMDAGADICVQSTHKQGGSLQQTAMIHWNQTRINSALLFESFRNLTTSSPSYNLVASLDAAAKEMQKNGKRRIEKTVQIASTLRRELDAIPGCRTVRVQSVRGESSGVYDQDRTKVLLDISESGFTGHELANILEEEYNIIVEKYNTATILFLVPFQTSEEAVRKTILALKFIYRNNVHKQKHTTLPNLEIPTSAPRILKLGQVANLYPNQIEQIPLSNAVGRISAENITPYPPGIPTTIMGEQFTPESIFFYQNIRSYPNTHILSHDITLKTVQVVKKK